MGSTDEDGLTAPPIGTGVQKISTNYFNGTPVTPTDGSGNDVYLLELDTNGNPVSITTTTIIKAIAVKNGMADSEVVSATFTKKSGGSGGGSSHRPSHPTYPTYPSYSDKPTIDTTVTTGTNAPDTDILDDDGIADKVLTDDDKEEIEDGGSSDGNTSDWDADDPNRTPQLRER